MPQRFQWIIFIIILCENALKIILVHFFHNFEINRIQIIFHIFTIVIFKFILLSFLNILMQIISYNFILKLTFLNIERLFNILWNIEIVNIFIVEITFPTWIRRNFTNFNNLFKYWIFFENENLRLFLFMFFVSNIIIFNYFDINVINCHFTIHW